MRCFALLIAAICSPVVTQAASVGLFSTPDCSSCDLTMGPGETRVFYIKAMLDDLPLTGAEFKVEGLPAAWHTSFVPTPQANFVLGDPFGSRGVNIGFPTTVNGDCVLFFTVNVTATNATTDVVLRVVGATPPSFPGFPCPLFIMECGPCEWWECVSGGVLFINSNEDCTVAVQPHTWTEVKSLYE